MMKWKEQLSGDCPKRDGRLHERCDLICPDVPKGAVRACGPAQGLGFREG
jgi:hypothetical protein